MQILDYFIFNGLSAQETLSNLTNIPKSIWYNYALEIDCPSYNDIKKIISTHNGTLPPDYREFTFYFTHITTSANECKSMVSNGILDLQKSYKLKDSELRVFLDNHGIFFNLDRKIMIYNNKEYTIDKNDDKVTKYCKEIGKRFYDDYNINGFFSMGENPYGGCVHERPEILKFIDYELGLNLSKEWHQSHVAYKIVGSVSGHNIDYNSNAEDSMEEKVLYYLMLAFGNIIGSPSQSFIFISKGVHIPANHIWEPELMKQWND